MTLRVLSFNSMNIANPVMMYRNRFQEIHRKCFMDRAIMFPVGSFFSWLQLRYLLCKNASYNINFSFLFCFFFNFLPLSIRYATGEHAHTQWVSASVHVSHGSSPCNGLSMTVFSSSQILKMMSSFLPLSFLEDTSGIPSLHLAARIPGKTSHC